MSSDSPLFLAPEDKPKGEAGRRPDPKPSEPLAHCKYFVSIEQPECGKPAPHRVRVPLGKAYASIDLCDEHKAVHDANNAARRAAHRAVRDNDNK